MQTLSGRVAVVLAVVLLSAGCLSGAPGVNPSPSTTATSSTETGSPAASTPTSTPGGHERASNQPDPDKSVHLANELNESVEMHVRVVREATDEPVHDGTYELEPGAERVVYDTAAADPDGIESFTVVLTARNTTERVTIRTDKCYGDVYGQVLEDGTVYLFHAIC